jgi:2-oxoglutarate ferredoxin oxidoreductase subunit alpha
MGAQGDLNVVTGTISGGMALPVMSVSDPVDAWELTAKAVEVAVTLRTPVVLLTSKEEVMTQFSLNPDELAPIRKVERMVYESDEPFFPYKAGENKVPPYLGVDTSRHQVRFTASTHDTLGIIQNSGAEALGNSIRLHEKITENLDSYTSYTYDEQEGAKTLVVSYGITAQAAREAVAQLRNEGHAVSLLIPKTLYPVPGLYFDIMSRYPRVVIAEENLTGQYRHLLFGVNAPAGVTGVNAFGKMITPAQIKSEVLDHGKNIS